ncbi:hypothetical protein CEXT_515691 [Caerostris extrusa]|uniref:Uncharacterized protein n=1 Tax=Caerostris extrusa TaxID=172846 RepID=A0AAV4MKT1_CAEEX|nr:hypothetical protein CEXT_515691 [Caerostris extrusa]
MKYTEETQTDRDMSAPVTSQNNQFEPERTFQSHFNRKYKNVGTKSSDSSKNADCVCQTQIREIVHRCRSRTSAEQSSSSKPKNDDFITETKIEQTIHLPPKI